MEVSPLEAPKKTGGVGGEQKMVEKFFTESQTNDPPSRLADSQNAPFTVHQFGIRITSGPAPISMYGKGSRGTPPPLLRPPPPPFEEHGMGQNLPPPPPSKEHLPLYARMAWERPWETQIGGARGPSRGVSQGGPISGAPFGVGGIGVCQGGRGAGVWQRGCIP